MNIVFRTASMADAARLLCWRNDQATRMAALNSAAVSLEDHLRWLQATLDNPTVSLYVVEDTARSAYVGTCRIDRRDGVYWLSLTIDPAQRGRGYAASLIGWMTERAKAEQAVAAAATILRDNYASLRAFWALGYRPDERLGHSDNAVCLSVRFAGQQETTHDAGTDAQGHPAAGSGAARGAAGAARNAKRRGRAAAPLAES